MNAAMPHIAVASEIALESNVGFRSTPDMCEAAGNRIGSE